MAVSDWQKYTKNYFSRFASPTPLLEAPFHPDCWMIIVIPCYNEPDLIGTLESLAQCELPEFSVEVIVVVNQSENATDDVTTQNKETISHFNNWSRKYHTDNTQKAKTLKFHLIEALDLPKKHAGVGLARKTGMDEALRRFASLQHQGTIVCLDADCRVSKNYLTAIAYEFTYTDSGLGEMSYAHPFESIENPDLRSGIVNYELFLRYYVEGLRQAGFPNAIHTVGSCMLVKASVYAKYGGMNKRKAGEDFYFLHKIVPHEQFVTVKGATVYPSCRTSDRVPFGTGKAQQDWLDANEHTYLTYDPRAFAELKQLLEAVPSLYSEVIATVLDSLTEPSRHFIISHDYMQKIALIKANASSESQFIKQFFIWFDGFLCMKYVHHLRDHFMPNIQIKEAASTLIQSAPEEVEDLLGLFRTIDRQH